MIPGKKAILQSVDLVLEQSKPVQIIGKSTILGQPVDITFTYNNGQTDAIAQMNNVLLKDIVSQVDGSPLDKTLLKSLIITVKNLISKSNAPKQLTMIGKADLSQTPGLEDAKEN